MNVIPRTLFESAPYSSIDMTTNSKVYSFETLKYLKFLLNQQKTESCKYYYQIVKYNRKQLETDHQFIQWLFPLTKPSSYSVNSPLIDVIELHSAIKNEPYILAKMRISYELILNHWGFIVIETPFQKENTIIDPFKQYVSYISIEPMAKCFGNRIKLLNGHNGLRLSRVLQSLVYHGLISLAIYTLSHILKHIDMLDPDYYGNTSITLWQHNLYLSIDEYYKIIDHTIYY